MFLLDLFVFQDGNQCMNLLFCCTSFSICDVDCFDCYVVLLQSGQVLYGFFALYVYWLHILACYMTTQLYLHCGNWTYTYFCITIQHYNPAWIAFCSI